ncbi:hypothetical protein DZC73_15135 [Albitalea terrae]|uniref:Uncharacterized protein n=2 Tax=Piscinibacter terrae TaxID=2496871 RepID=A0A3N7HMU3_9BURK|nr:hypothetical protein DZC73_15135 [Albitalea terrae]
MNDSTLQFAQQMDRVMQKATLDTVQDELVMLCGLLLQDVLADQKLRNADVTAYKERTLAVLCSDPQAGCQQAKTHMDAIVDLYRRPAADDDQKVHAAVVGLMSEVVSWLDRHPAAIASNPRPAS